MLQGTHYVRYCPLFVHLILSQGLHIFVELLGTFGTCTVFRSVHITYSPVAMRDEIAERLPIFRIRQVTSEQQADISSNGLKKKNGNIYMMNYSSFPGYGVLKMRVQSKRILENIIAQLFLSLPCKNICLSVSSRLLSSVLTLRLLDMSDWWSRQQALSNQNSTTPSSSDPAEDGYPNEQSRQFGLEREWRPTSTDSSDRSSSSVGLGGRMRPQQVDGSLTDSSDRSGSSGRGGGGTGDGWRQSPSDMSNQSNTSTGTDFGARPHSQQGTGTGVWRHVSTEASNSSGSRRGGGGTAEASYGWGYSGPWRRPYGTGEGHRPGCAARCPVPLSSDGRPLPTPICPLCIELRREYPL